MRLWRRRKGFSADQLIFSRQKGTRICQNCVERSCEVSQLEQTILELAELRHQIRALRDREEALSHQVKAAMMETGEVALRVRDVEARLKLIQAGCFETGAQTMIQKFGGMSSPFLSIRFKSPAQLPQGPTHRPISDWLRELWCPFPPRAALYIQASRTAPKAAGAETP